MWSRTRFDISWSDLVFGVRSGLAGGEGADLQRQLEALWSDDDDSLAAYSVRSGFDLLLQALALPPDSEVLFSAITIKGMIKAARRLDLVPVPVDLDVDHLAPRPDALERAITPRSRVLVVAPLFGIHLDLGPVLEIARRHDLFVVEDCAQAFTGRDYTGHPGVDASLFSFGPLKTATALGGALLRVRDADVLRRMRELQAGYPVQQGSEYLARLVKFAALKCLTYRVPTRLLHGLFSATRRDVDAQVTDAVRGLARQKSAKSLHQRPCRAMLALLRRRLVRWRPADLEARARLGERLLACVRGAVVCPGGASGAHAFWAFPILVKHSAAVLARLRAAGFDAADVVSLSVVPAPAGRAELRPVVAEQLLAELVFLPCYASIGAAEIDRQAATLLRTLESPS